ncbi:uncharacterized protein [Engystomops pustulosus]|uniref:uncharacterized protein n=1 Tax=Engystomops pustulosus TaxID=76066 RepID=UPI003AFA311C
MLLVGLCLQATSQNYYTDDEESLTISETTISSLQLSQQGESSEEDPGHGPEYDAELQWLISSLCDRPDQGDSDNGHCFQNDPRWGPGEERPEPEGDPEGRLLGTAWCSCTLCHTMPSVSESFCCKESEELHELPCVNEKCITENAGFIEQCTLKEHLQRFITFLRPQHRHYYDINDNRALRLASYRCFTMWVHGILGKHNRVPIPACVICKIRDLYPDPNGQYTGFQYYVDVNPDLFDMDLNF